MSTNEFRKMRIALDQHNDVEVTAKLIASESSRREGADRWAELSVLVTPERLYVAQIRGVSLVSGESTITNTAFVNSEAMLKQFFGDGRLAKKLLSAINAK